MPTPRTTNQQDRSTDQPDPRRTDHSLVAVTEYLPGREPTDYDVDLTEGPPYTYRTRFWRCRKCGQERNRRSEFTEPCEGAPRPHPLSDGGYSIDDPRTRRALSEDMDVRFGTQGPVYAVESERGTTYEVDIDAETCTCPDWTERTPEGGCKHLRRVDLEIRTGVVPQPDGTFVR